MNAVAQQNELIRQHGESNGGGMSVYDRVDPFKFIDDMGRVFGMTGAGGADTLEKGKLLALACLSRRMDIFQLSGTYHLIGGKLSMKADVMLAKFRQAGGKHQWLKDGSDGQQASAVFTFEGNSHTVSYSMEDAKRADLLAKPGKNPGNWEKNPGPMLRARVVSSGVRMLAPEVLEGSYAPEELDGIEDSTPVQGTVVNQPAPSAASVVGVDQSQGSTEKTTRKRRTAAEIAAENTVAQQVNQPQGQQQSAAQSTATTATSSPESSTATKSDEAGEVIDASFTVVNGEVVTDTPITGTAQIPVEPAKEPVFNPDLPGTSLTATLHAISAVAIRLNTNQAGIEAILKGKDPAFRSIPDLSETKAKALLAQLEGMAKAAGK